MVQRNLSGVLKSDENIYSGDATMTPTEIRNASNKELLALLKEDLDDDLYDTISYELFEYREAGRGENIYA
tara:strand:- start:341 stop:553 length:213 start_codon:yes stop_codon:yes gene_type:complete